MSVSPPRLPKRPPHRIPHSPGLHLAALGNDDVEVGHVLALVAGPGGLHLLDHVHAVDDLAKDDVLAVEEGRGHGGDEELGAVCVGAGILLRVSASSAHAAASGSARFLERVERGLTAMESRPGWSCLRVKFSSSKDLNPQMQVDPEPSPLRKSPPWHMKLGICAPRGKPSAQHATASQRSKRGTDDAVKLGALVALGPAGRALGLAGAEVVEVVGRLGDDVAEELKGDAAQRFAWRPRLAGRRVKARVRPSTYRRASCRRRRCRHLGVSVRVFRGDGEAYRGLPEAGSWVGAMAPVRTALAAPGVGGRSCLVSSAHGRLVCLVVVAQVGDVCIRRLDLFGDALVDDPPAPPMAAKKKEN